MVVACIFFGLLVTLTVVAIGLAIFSGARSSLFTKLWDKRKSMAGFRPWDNFGPPPGY